MSSIERARRAAHRSLNLPLRAIDSKSSPPWQSSTMRWTAFFFVFLFFFSFFWGVGLEGGKRAIDGFFLSGGSRGERQVCV